jgi:hypothetical protein
VVEVGTVVERHDGGAARWSSCPVVERHGGEGRPADFGRLDVNLFDLSGF